MSTYKSIHTGVAIDAAITDAKYLLRGVVSITRTSVDALDTLTSVDDCGIYSLAIDGVPRYTAVIVANVYLRNLTQYIIGDLAVKDGRVTGEHYVGNASIIFRCYNYTTSEWSSWRNVGHPYEIITADQAEQMGKNGSFEEGVFYYELEEEEK